MSEKVEFKIQKSEDGEISKIILDDKNEDTESKYENIEAKCEDTKVKYEDTEGKYENTEGKYENIEGNYQDTEDKYEDTEDKYENTEVKYENIESKYEENEDYSSIDKFTGNNQSSEQQFDIEGNIDDLRDVREEEEVADNVNNEYSLHYCSNENLNFAEISSFSPSIMTKEAAVVSHSEVYMIPLTKNRSSGTEPCSCVDAEGNMLEALCGCSYDDDVECNHVSFETAQKRESLMVPGLIRVPIVGYETMEARSKFTVFKIHVMVEDDEVGWFIFRRYSDFAHLNDQLKLMFSSFRFILPPKRWFKSNFDIDFLEERQRGLQSFIDNVTGHRDICNSKPVSDFFCFDDPPGPHDSLEESRAQCECLEETVYLLRKELSEKDTEIELLKEEVDLYRNQVELLSNRLSELNKMSTMDRSGHERHRFQADEKQVDADPNYGQGDVMLMSTLDSVTEC